MHLNTRQLTAVFLWIINMSTLFNTHHIAYLMAPPVIKMQTKKLWFKEESPIFWVFLQFTFSGVLVEQVDEKEDVLGRNSFLRQTLEQEDDFVLPNARQALTAEAPTLSVHTALDCRTNNRVFSGLYIRTDNYISYFSIWCKIPLLGLLSIESDRIYYKFYTAPVFLHLQNFFYTLHRLFGCLYFHSFKYLNTAEGWEFLKYQN